MTQRSTAESAVLVTVALVISTMLGFGREVVLAAHFGATRQADTLLVALLLPNFFLNLLTAAALGSAVVPVFTSHIGPLATSEQRRIIGSAFALTSLVLVAFASVAVLTAPLLVRLITPGFTSSEQALVALLMRVMMPSVVFLGLSNLVTGVLHTLRRFGAAATVGAVWNLAIVVATLTLAPRLGIVAPALGVLAGSFLQLAVMIPSLVRTGFFGAIGFRFRDPILMRIWILFLPILGVSLFQQVMSLFEKFIGSFLPAGRIAALSYGYKIATGPTGIFGLAVATVFLPSFSRQVHEKSRDLALTISRGLNTIAVLIWPWVATCIALRVPLVTFLLERGAFDRRATALVASPLAIFSLCAYAEGVNGMLTKAFYSHHDSRTPLIIDLVTKALWALAVLATLKFIGYGALALGAVVGTNTAFALLLVCLRRLVPDLSLTTIGSGLARIAAAAAVGGVAAWFAFEKMTHLVGPLSTLQEGAALVSSAAVSLAVFVLTARVLRVHELHELGKMVVELGRARLGRRS